MNLIPSFKKFFYFILLFILTNSAHSQTFPGAANPGVISQELQKQSTSESQPARESITSPKEQPDTDLSPEAKKITFKLNGVILTGNKMYSTNELKVLYQQYLNKTISIGQLFKIAQSITNFYRNNGYIISRAIIPPQEVKTGVVKIQVIEGYVGHVRVVGCPHRARCLVQKFGNKIAACRPLYLPRMEKYLLLANEIPQTEVKVELSPSKGLGGASDIALKTINRPLTGYFSYDNYGTRYIGPLQMSGNVALNSSILSGDALTFTMIKTTKGAELTYNDINYNAPLDDEGTRFLIGGTRTHTHPLFLLRPFQIDGLNTNFYSNVYFPEIRSRSETKTWRFGFNYNDNSSNSFNFKLYRDHLRPLDLGLTWIYADKYYGTNNITGDIRYGLPLFGATSDTSSTAETSRPRGRGSNFLKFAGQYSRTQTLFSSWSVVGLLSGQWAFNPLLSGEQFTYGGPILGRGYDVAELIGDRGAAGSLEFRYDISFKLLQSAQIYAFYDAGIIWNIIYGDGIPGRQSATSTGIGARFALTKLISGNIMWAQPLTKKVSAENLIGRGWRPRVFFSIVASSY